MLNKQLLNNDLYNFSGSYVEHMTSEELSESFDFLLPISNSYPGIEAWFNQKVIPGLYNSTRKLFVHRRNGTIVALGIAKKTESELKVCTVRVASEYAGKGLGIKIFKEAMEWLGTDKPHLTVSEDRLPDFEKIFTHFGYNLTSTVKGLYSPNKVEYFFNESKSFTK